MVIIWCFQCNFSGNPARPEGGKRERYNPHGVRRVSASALESTLSKKSMKEEHNNVQRITSNFVGFRAPRQGQPYPLD